VAIIGTKDVQLAFEPYNIKSSEGLLDAEAGGRASALTWPTYRACMDHVPFWWTRATSFRAAWSPTCRPGGQAMNAAYDGPSYDDAASTRNSTLGLCWAKTPTSWPTALWSCMPVLPGRISLFGGEYLRPRNRRGYRLEKYSGQHDQGRQRH